MEQERRLEGKTASYRWERDSNGSFLLDGLLRLSVNAVQRQTWKKSQVKC